MILDVIHQFLGRLPAMKLIDRGDRLVKTFIRDRTQEQNRCQTSFTESRVPKFSMAVPRPPVRMR